MTVALTRWTIAAVMLVAIVSCDQEDTFLGGKWEAKSNELTAGESGTARSLGAFLGVCSDDDAVPGTLPEACEVYPRIVLGHYGSDVVGLITWSANSIATDDVKCMLRPTPISLPCSRVDTRYVDPEFSFELYLCDGSRRATVYKIDSGEIQLSISPDRTVGKGCEKDGQCPNRSVRLQKTAEDKQLSQDDKDEAACEPKPTP